jgi:hypothetical protein
LHTKDKMMIGTRYTGSQMHEWIKTIKPAASGEMANPIEANKLDKTCNISKAFGASVNDKGQHLLVDAAEVCRTYTFYVAGQAEKMFAVDGTMVGALRASFPGMQMGKVSVDGKPFTKTIPGILEVSFIAPVSRTGRSSSSASTS